MLCTKQYVFLSLASFVKDAVVVFMYMRSETPKGYDAFVVFVSFVDALIIEVTKNHDCFHPLVRVLTCFLAHWLVACWQPMGAYYGFYHFQSLSTTLTFEKVSDSP